MKKKLFAFFVGIILFNSCTQEQPDPRAIMDMAMQAHGTDQTGIATMSFDFRGITYTVQRNAGQFEYERQLMIGADTIQDRLNNKGFNRYRNAAVEPLPDSLRTRYTSSLNSVVYFAQLPYSLDGEAINLRYIGQDSIKGKTYHEIEVTFKEEGGGEDYDDVFVYWVNTQDHLIDYLAYSYCEEECGYRFRESYNRRKINGVVVQDYHNYKSLQADPKLAHMDDLFENERLEKLSEINLQRVRVTTEN